MGLTTVNTEHFSDVELAAKAVAEQIEDLQLNLSKAKAVAQANWIGDGATEFANLYSAINQQMKDISEDFWDVYETLVDIEGEFLEADQSLATDIASGTIETS